MIGLYLVVAPFFHRSLMGFLSPGYVPVFGTLFFVLVADVAIRREAGVLRMAALGLLVGAMLELYVTTVVMLPGAVLLWLWRRPRIPALGWVAMVATLPLCWIPDIVSANGSIEIILNRPGLMHPAGGGPWQPVRLIEILDTFGTRACFYGLLFFIVNKLTRRSTLSPAETTLFVFGVLQLAIPIAAYSLFSGTYVTIMYPAYAVPFALLPSVLSDTFTLIPYFRARRTMALILACVPVVSLWFSDVSATVPYALDYYNRFRFHKTANLIYLSQHACELGLSSSLPSWQGKIAGTNLSIPAASWDYLKKNYAQPCDHQQANRVIILFADDYIPQEGDRVLEKNDLVFVGQTPLMEYQVVFHPDVKKITGELFPGAAYLGVTTNLSNWETADQFKLIIDDQEVPIAQQSNNRHTRQYDSELYIFKLPDPERSRKFTLEFGSAMVTDTVYLLARRQPIRMYEIRSDNPHAPPQ